MRIRPIPSASELLPLQSGERAVFSLDISLLDRLIINHSDAFGHPPEASHVYVLEIDRDPWNYSFVSPRELYFAYFQEGAPLDAQSAKLDTVLHCRNIGYRWKPVWRETVAQ